MQSPKTLLVLEITAVAIGFALFIIVGKIFYPTTGLAENILPQPTQEQQASNPQPVNTIIAVTSTPTAPVMPAATPTPTPDNNNFSSGYDYKPVAQAKGTVRIPILTFHHIGALPKDSASKPYYVTPKMFEQMLQYLKMKNYRTLTTQEFYDAVKSGKNPKQKSVMLTFDDGNQDSYTAAYPLLKKYGFVGVFYVNTKRLKISTQHLKEMSDHGMVIDSHTASHLDLSKVNDQKQLISEIATSKAVLESITKRKVVSVSYPGCTYNTTVVKIAANAGYKFGVSCGSKIDHYPSKLFALSRMHVYNDFENFKKRLSGYWYIP